MSDRIPIKSLSDPSILLATGFGSGLFPVAPGTAGTLFSLCLFVFAGTQSAAYLVFVLLAFLGGIWVCGRASTKLGKHDHGSIVWDEFVGMWITMIWMPITWGSLIAGFLLFRLFDIVKPWPIGWLDQRVSGGLGIMLDDVLAGVFAWVSLWLLLQMIPGLFVT